jgi:hypothetical protein
MQKTKIIKPILNKFSSENYKVTLKHVMFFLIIWGVLGVIVELFSFLLLVTVLKTETTIDYFDAKKLTDKFPAQFRLSSNEIRKMFPRALPTNATGNYMTFPFDPVMGFRANNAIEWYGGSLDNLESKFLIVTFGGSTTVKDNWPRSLIKYARKENVKKDIVVLNAGHWGYMSFNEKIYFTSWILPQLTKSGVKPDLVLSLDGVNDIWSRIMGFMESENQNSPVWYSQYHGYHQQLDTDMRNLDSFGKSVSQAFSSLAKKSYRGVINYMSPIFPYTIKAGLELARNVVQNAPSQEEIIEIASANKYKLGEKTEKDIIDAYKSCLLDFYGAAEIRKINYISYLQPVLLDKYYPHPVPESFNYPNFNYFAVNFFTENKHWNRFGGRFLVPTEGLYEKAEKMYSDLNADNHGHFENLAYILKDIPHADKAYVKDAIHYNKQGKEKIAHTIIKDLISKNIL